MSSEGLGLCSEGELITALTNSEAPPTPMLVLVDHGSRTFTMEGSVETDDSETVDNRSNNQETNSLAKCEPMELPPSPSIGKRRRRYKKDNWQSEIERKKRMRGDSYLGYERGLDSKRTMTKMKSGRKLGLPCVYKNCTRTKRRHCSEFPKQAREQLFHEFWETMDWNAKKPYVRGLVDRVDPKYARTPGSTRKQRTSIYYLKLNGLKRHVCRQMFLSTLGLTRKEVTGCLNSNANSSKIRNTSIGQQQRSDSKINGVKSYLENLPKMPSHYCRASSKKLYLDPLFTSHSQLYGEYKKYCVTSELKAVSINTFRGLINDMKISLFTPKKDKCDVCCGYEAKNITEDVWKAHQLKKEAARMEKNLDKANALSGICHVVCVDVQAVMLSPMINASALYYKTKLMAHNYSVINLRTRHVTCFFWDETEADLVASTFATCLVTYLDKHFQDGLPIIVYSDGCTNQNRNVVLSNAILQYAMRKQKTIYQKYLEKGHTQNEVDSVHATIERNLKGKNIFVPTDYIDICKNARKHPEPYDVRYMKNAEFVDYSSSKNLRYSSIRPGKATGDPHVTDICQLRYNPEGNIDYKIDHAAEWQPLPREPSNTFAKRFPKLYKKRFTISKRKYQDLQDLLCVIPEKYHEFYKLLPQ